MSVIVPRWYQTEGIQAVWDYFATESGNPVLAYPTGTGKSVVIAGLVQRALREYPGTRIIKLTHRKELIHQNFEKLLNLWPLAPAGIYSAGLNRKEHRHAITYAGIDSVARQPQLFGHIDLVIIDECHAVNPKEGTKYHSFLAGLLEQNKQCKVIGLSATPYRVGQGLVIDDGIFTDICYDLTTFDNFNRLIAEGWLASLIPKQTGVEIDLSAVRVQSGEYNQHDLQVASDREEITRLAVAEMLAQGADRKCWLIFASGVEHSDHVAAELCDRGIKAVSIHSKLGDEARDEAIRLWKSGHYQAAVNNDILTTGIDHPPIDLIGVLRATRSPGLWVQILGRGTRPWLGKPNCLVLDFAGNTRRLGPINDPVLPKKRGHGGGPAPVKLCPACQTYNHASVQFCSCCGQEFTRYVKFVDKADTLALVAGSDPVVETFPIRNIDYTYHAPHPASGKRTPSLKVTYHSGLRCFYEWVCLEHTGNIQRKAAAWWIRRSVDCALGFKSTPVTIAEALARLAELDVPVSIRVWVKTKNSEILGCNFVSDEAGK